MQADSGKNDGGLSALKRKVKKFLPLHLLTLLAAMPFNYAALLNLDIEAWGSFALNALMLQSWVPMQSVYFSYNSVAWYLTLTVFFIVATPLVGKFAKRVKPYAWTGIAICVAIAQILWALMLQTSANGQWLVYICPIVRLLDFILGYGAFQLTKELKTILDDSQKYIYIPVLLAITMCIVLTVLSMNFEGLFFTVSVWTIPVLTLTMSVALGASKAPMVRWVFENRIIVFMGNISFEFFLLHQLAIRYCRKIGEYIGIGDSVVFGIGILLLSIAAAWVWQNMFAIIKQKRKGVALS